MARAREKRMGLNTKLKYCDFMTSKFPFKKKRLDLSDSTKTADPNPEFSKAIDLFTSQRKNFGISLEELSNKTKISRNVLIAIENGWKQYLPESTYLISMLKKIEIELNLEKGSLNGILSRKVVINNLSDFKFNFINIDFLNSWIGSLLYFIFMLLSILALNVQQKYLINIYTTSTEPIILDETDIENEDLFINQNQK